MYCEENYLSQSQHNGVDVAQKPCFWLFSRLFVWNQSNVLPEIFCKSVYFAYTQLIGGIHPVSLALTNLRLPTKLPCNLVKTSSKTERIYSVNPWRYVLDLELHKICIKGYGNEIKQISYIVGKIQELEKDKFWIKRGFYKWGYGVKVTWRNSIRISIISFKSTWSPVPSKYQI